MRGLFSWDCVELCDILTRIRTTSNVSIYLKIILNRDKEHGLSRKGVILYLSKIQFFFFFLIIATCDIDDVRNTPRFFLTGYSIIMCVGKFSRYTCVYIYMKWWMHIYWSCSQTAMTLQGLMDVFIPDGGLCMVFTIMLNLSPARVGIPMWRRPVQAARGRVLGVGLSQMTSLLKDEEPSTNMFKQIIVS